MNAITPAKATAFGGCYLLLQKAFALLWVMSPQEEESEPSMRWHQYRVWIELDEAAQQHFVTWI